MGKGSSTYLTGAQCPSPGGCQGLQEAVPGRGRVREFPSTPDWRGIKAPLQLPQGLSNCVVWYEKGFWSSHTYNLRPCSSLNYEPFAWGHIGLFYNFTLSITIASAQMNQPGGICRAMAIAQGTFGFHTGQFFKQSHFFLTDLKISYAPFQHLPLKPKRQFRIKVKETNGKGHSD